LVGGLEARRVDIAHDLRQARLRVVEGPRVAAGVLLHLQRTRRDAARVRGLAGTEAHAGHAEDLDGLRGARHVRALRDALEAVRGERARVLLVQLVLRGAGQGDVDGHIPHAAALHVADVAAAALGVLVDATALDLLDLTQQVEVDALLIGDVAAGVRGRDRDAAQLLRLLDRVDRDVAGAGDAHAATVEGRLARPEHLVREDRRAVAGGLCADQ